MRQKIIIATLCLLTIFSTGACASENTATLEPEEIVYEETTDPGRIQYYLIIYTDRKEHAHNMAEAARGLGYENDHPVIQLAQKEWGAADEAFKHYQELWNTLYGTK